MLSKMLSLYDYLGKAAGKELGKQVAESAASMGVKVQTKPVTNPKYSGEVCMYPETFLALYFKNNNA
jgi:hypothetical protein